MTTNDPFSTIDPIHAANAIGSLLQFIRAGDTGATSPENPITNSDAFSMSSLQSQAPQTPSPSTNTPITPEQTQQTMDKPVGNSPGDTADPVPKGTAISQGYGGQGGHPGVDLSVPVGTTIVSAINGTVTVAGNTDPNGYGNEVEVTSANGVVTRYGHLSYVGTKQGDHVVAGQPIGKSGGIKGAAGSGNSTGPHLHFEVRQDGHTVDPLPYLAGGAQILAPGAGPTVSEVRSAESKPVNPQDAVDTGVGRLLGTLIGNDPGSENSTVVSNPQAVADQQATGNNAQVVQVKGGMDTYFASVLKGIGAPVTAVNLSFMRALMRAEGGSTDNPFNVTEPAPGATTINSHGVKRYADQQTGIASTIKLMLNGLYPGLINALRNGSDPNAIIQGFSSSPWVGGGSSAEADLIRKIMAE